MVAPVRRVLVRRPDESFRVGNPARWNYAASPDLEIAQQEHDQLVAILAGNGIEVINHDAILPGLADSIFVFDPVLVTNHGVIQLRMGKELRNGEPESLASRVAAEDIPVLGQLSGEATAEGGDMFWLDEQTLAVGRGFRTNQEGIQQLRQILANRGIEVVSFDLPVFDGPKACLHLLSLLSLVDERLAVVYPRLLPVHLWRTLNDRGFTLIEVADEEFMTMGPNVLALGPGKCVILDQNRKTAEQLRKAGCEVFTYSGRELSLKAEGGPTCLTLPILRSSE